MESILASIKALTQSFSHDRCNSNLRIHLYPRAHNHLIPRPCFQIYLDYYIFILPAISLLADQFANFYSLLLSCLIFLLLKNLWYCFSFNNATSEIHFQTLDFVLWFDHFISFHYAIYIQSFVILEILFQYPISIDSWIISNR